MSIYIQTDPVFIVVEESAWKLRVFTPVYIHICIYIYIDVHIHEYKCIYIHMYIMYVCNYLHTCIHTYKQARNSDSSRKAHLYTYIYVRVHIHLHIHLHIHRPSIHTHRPIFLWPSIYIHRPSMLVFVQSAREWSEEAHKECAVSMYM